MRNGTTDLGNLTVAKGGLDGGGWVTGIDIADDGYMVCRTDCGGIAGVRGPSDTEWTQLFRWGDNISASEYATKVLTGENPTSWIYEAAIAPSNSQRIYAPFLGFVWRTDNRAVSWTKTNFKSAVRDQTLTFRPHHEARIGGQHMAVHPTNPDIVVLGHPVDGAYYSTDAGANWTLIASIPAPINSGSERRGVNVTFDRTDNSVVVVVQGRGVYRASAVTGTFALVGTGYPTTSSSVSAANGRIFVCGNGTLGSQLFVWNGSAWSQPTAGGDPVLGNSVAARPGFPAQVLCMDVGGDQCYSSDAGNTWSAHRNINFETDGAECPYLAAVNNDYMSLGRFVWHPTVSRIIASCGIGVFQIDTVPRTSTAQLYADKTLGIQQKLVMDFTVTPSGKVLTSCQDKPLYIHSRSGALQQPTTNHPDLVIPIRHANTCDYAVDDENYLVLPYTPAATLTDPATPTLSISTDGGASWSNLLDVPTYTAPDGTANTRMHGGNVAVGNAGNFVWAATRSGPLRTRRNNAWVTPTFHATQGGASIDVSRARWHHDFTAKRTILRADKTTAGRFLVFVSHLLNEVGTQVAAPYAGLYESTDEGRTFILKRAGFIFSDGEDPFSIKMHLVPGNANHLFFTRGNVGSYGNAPAAGGLKFTADLGATAYVELPNFAEVEDIAFGKPKAGNSYPRLLVKGFYNGVTGYHQCDDFNPANPSAATWTLRTQFPMGRADDGNALAGDMNKLGRFYVGTSAGGFQQLDREYKLRAS